MSRIGAVWPAVACVITGAALYATRGVLDQVIINGAATRVALLPPWQALVGFVGLAAVILVVVDHLNAPRGTTTFKRPKLRDLALPLLASVVLVLPYVPVLPDRLPVLQMLAGPFRWVVWIVIAAQLVWVLWQTRLITAKWIEGWTLTRLTSAIWVMSALLFLAAGERISRSEWFPSGDEPHYLIIAQSLWRDHDLAIENNHKRGDYGEYYLQPLEPDYLVRGRDRQIYSIHPVGLPLLISPVYAAGGYHAVVWFLALIAATASTIAWRWAVRVLNAPGAATFAWAAIAASAPYLLNSAMIYPEVTAGLAVIAGFTTGNAWVVGICCAVLPWLSTKYAPMSAALLLIALARNWKKEPGSLLRDPKVRAVVAPYVVSLIAWFAYFFWIWGSPLPQSPYGTMTQTSPGNWPLGIPGLLFDQEFGLVACAPVYILAFTGLWAMWRAGGAQARLAMEICMVCAALLLTVSGHRLWWGGDSAPARPLVSGMLLLLPAIAAAFRAAPAGSARRSAHHLLLWISIGAGVTILMAQGGGLVAPLRDGTSPLLELWSPRWQVWALVPSFVSQSIWTALAQTAVWLIVAAAVALVLSRVKVKDAGASALTATALTAAALSVLAIVVPLVPANPPAPAVNLQSRARLSALDDYDARAKPAAVLYDPARHVPARDVVPLLTVEVEPGGRHDHQPVRVLHNGRFSLPAGTYDVEVAFADRDETRTFPLELQIGRNGPAFQTWNVQPKSGERFTTTLDLPVDANFVGFRGSTELERDVARIAFTATSVVNAGVRPALPQVLSAGRYDGALVFMHEEYLYPEPDGFWTIGNRPNRLTIASLRGPAVPTVLRVHCGPQANRMTISTRGWQQTYSLIPGQAQDVELPWTANGVIPLLITTHTGFSPLKENPQSRDPRFLGVWVEIKKN